MSAQPVQEFDPDDPMEIMCVLPARYHEQFLTDYDAAAASARRPARYHEPHQTLRLWRLRAGMGAAGGFLRLGDLLGLRWAPLRHQDWFGERAACAAVPG